MSTKTKMRAEQVKIDDLHCDPANVRVHSERNLAAIKASLARFGQQKPVVVDAKNVIVAGNGTVEAARALEWKTVAVVRTGLKGADRAAYAIADNRTGELAGWDFEGLAGQLKALADDVDLNALGWADHEIEMLSAADWKPPSVEPLDTLTRATGDAKPIEVTVEQRVTIDMAIARCREVEGDDSLSEGRCVELICERYVETGEDTGR